MIDMRLAVTTIFMVVQDMGIMVRKMLSNLPKAIARLARHHMRERAFRRGNRLPGKYDQQDEEQHLVHQVGRPVGGRMR